MDKRYIKKKLEELSNEHDVPGHLVPQLIHLMETFPNTAEWGAKSGLKTGIEKIINNAMKEGKL
ncbi:MAG: hypothetical protein MJA29_05540 [Candidatus Omnitrophica bacterium]|nr:hypothetical protein [Candidatus Omnitrophota bacterium]